jgi:preprotein translocase subunit SecD
MASMTERNFRFLAFVIILAAAAAWVVWPGNQGLHVDLGPVKINQDIKIHQGLDLQGGLQVLLEADLPPEQEVPAGALADAKVVVENRINGLGVTEPLIQLQGDRRIVVELPGIDDPDLAIKTFGETGLLEFVDAGDTGLRDGTRVETTFSTAVEGETAITPTVTASEMVTSSGEITPTGRVYKTILTGKDLKSAKPQVSQLGEPEVAFELNPEGAQIFAQFTAANVGKYLCITLDKEVISCPVIKSAIPDGSGVITMGGGNIEEARSLAIQLRYGALPIPLKPVEIRTVGPTLGQDSVRRSIIAGIIGMLTVVVFMLLYYRLPGALADVALLIYAAVVFALYKLIPVTLTLPGFAGFILSVGMAVDANILIFERMKEELRAGRRLEMAVDAGFARAWPSIRDSNISTLITCVILFWFGANYGASIVKGFALTLGIGVLVSMFTAIMVTRTFLRLTMNMDLTRNHWWFGV